MTWDSDIYTCEYCGREDMVLASGPRKAKILIINDEPDEDAVKKGKPMVGAVGKILRAELARVGLDLNQMRITNLWLHPQQKIGAKDTEGLEIKKKCFAHGVGDAIKEARNRQTILLLGSESVKFFCDEKISEVNGLVVQSTHLSAPLIFACTKIESIFRGGLGEVRLSIQKFSKKVNEL